YLYYFFFQAEDGIRDRNVTGVQTCALPIYSLDCITSINLPPLSTSIIASNVDTYSLTPYSFAYFSTVERCFNTSADTETLPPPAMSKSFPPDEDRKSVV